MAYMAYLGRHGQQRELTEGHLVMQGGHWVSTALHSVGVAGQFVAQGGHWVLTAGHIVLNGGHFVASMGHIVSFVGQVVAMRGHRVLTGGHAVQITGHLVAQGGHLVTTAGHKVYIAGHLVGITDNIVGQGQPDPTESLASATSAQLVAKSNTTVSHNNLDLFFCTLIFLSSMNEMNSDSLPAV